MEVDELTILADMGSVVMFSGSLADGSRIKFAVDHRPAQELINGMLNDEDVVALVEPYQIIGR